MVPTIDRNSTSSVWRPARRIILLVLILGFVVFIARNTAIGQAILPHDFDELSTRVHSFDPLDRLAYVGVYWLGTVLLVPGTILSFIGATLYGTIQGTALTWAGAMLGSSTLFWLVRSLGRDAVRTLANSLFGGHFDTFDRWVEANGFHAFLLIRLVPVFPFNGVNLGAGLTSIRFGPYVLATGIGILPGTFVYQYLFAHVGRAILQDGFRGSYLLDPNLLIPIAVFVTFLVLARLLTGRLKNRVSSPEASAHVKPDSQPPTGGENVDTGTD